MAVSTPVSESSRQRWRLTVRGIVQGVGFRPAVCRLARARGLAGFVRNDGDAVCIEVEGEAAEVARFGRELEAAPPPSARIDSVDWSALPLIGDAAFRIAASEASAAPIAPSPIPPDLGPCEACLAELADPRDRRFGYPFINCTDCGPRFSIVRGLPYDRARTTMAAFELCADCRREYGDPLDRRFHAEPNACPVCGPQAVFRAGAAAVQGGGAIAAAAQALAAGRIVAVKGAGGYALAVDATNEAAVARLRARKRRPHKPFAVMVRSLADAERVAEVDGAARAELRSPARPIVLCPARAGSPLAPSVAPGLGDVGLLLPPTPLQLLLAEAGPPLLVMTSGNASSEPIAIDDEDAAARLAGIADALLAHDRAIEHRADDSVVRQVGAGVIPVRRARGYVPGAIDLGCASAPILAVGGQRASTVCLTRGGRAVLSQHIGDLADPATFAFFEQVIERLVREAGVAPAVVAHDLHPDYRSTRWALAAGLPAVAVQHHHAHVAACLADAGHTGRAIGVAFDGTGYGPDGTVWGGEFLDVDGPSAHRVARLRPLRLVGGELAIREPWRLAAAALADAGEPCDRLRGCTSDARLEQVRALATAGNGALASGAGRWFDAVAALAGVRAVASYDGQPAAELEAIAAPGPASPYELAVDDEPGQPPSLDLRPAVRAIAADLRRGTPPARIAARFHETMAAAVLAGCRLARDAGCAPVVALTGGCFVNRRLLERSRALLEADGFSVLVHRRVPPGDGGLALGQAAVAARLVEAGGGHVPGHSR